MRKDKLAKINSYLENLKTHKFELLTTKSTFLSILKYKCYLNNGQIITREKLLKGKTDGSAVIILAVTKENEFILAIEPRVFTKETVDIGLPAGYIEENERPVESAERELLEETGYKAEKFIPLGSFYQDQGVSGAYNYYFLATGCHKVKDQSLDKDEFIKYILVSYEELNYLLENNYIKGLNSAYAILKSQKLVRKREGEN